MLAKGRTQSCKVLTISEVGHKSNSELPDGHSKEDNEIYTVYKGEKMMVQEK